MNAALMAYYEVTLGEWKRDAGTEQRERQAGAGGSAGARERGARTSFPVFRICFPVMPPEIPCSSYLLAQRLRPEVLDFRVLTWTLDQLQGW
jgi:hypothetical protein